MRCLTKLEYKLQREIFQGVIKRVIDTLAVTVALKIRKDARSYNRKTLFQIR